MTSRLARIGAFFLEPAAPVPDREPGRAGTSRSAGSHRGRLRPAGHGRAGPGRAVLGAAPRSCRSRGRAGALRARERAPRGGALPLATAVRRSPPRCAGELRRRAAAAAVPSARWRPRAPAPARRRLSRGPRPPAGATTPGARRLAARLAAQRLAATACGRLAWLALDADPAAAARPGAPLPARVAARAGRPRRRGAAPGRLRAAPRGRSTSRSPSCRRTPTRRCARSRSARSPRASGRRPPLPPGPPRWAAMAGLARLRSLPPPARAAP